MTRLRTLAGQKLLMGELTEWHLDDANIVRSDSYAVPDHPIMSRFWQRREEMEENTVVIGLNQNADRDVRQVATSSTSTAARCNVAKMLRQKIMSLAGRG